MMTRAIRAGSLCAFALLALPSQAQVVAANVAVPYYNPPAFVQGVHRYWYAPRAQEFAQAAAELVPALQAVCTGGANALATARTRWQAAAVAFDRLAAVPIGPLVERRSIRQIDFTPTRPQLIARAIQQAPADAAAMERVGTPAKGLPALEWLLWTRPVAAGTPGCSYAVLVAGGVESEARALAKAFGELGARDWSSEEEAAVTAMGELLNQWVGGLERLRWANIEKPVRSAGGKPPVFPRAASDTTRRSWGAQWEGLAALGVARGNEVPQPGAGLVPLETYLRGRGLNPLADRLASTARTAGQAVQAANPARQPEALAASRSLAALKRLAEAEVAPALEVNIGFSDADGD